MKRAAYFISHGAPSLPLQQTPARFFLEGLGRQIEASRGGPPDAILCISAHWGTRNPTISTAKTPATLHDFYGFPSELYRLNYPAPGAVDAAQRAQGLLNAAGFECQSDPAQGLDHGAWNPLLLMWPEAKIPVAQIAIQPDFGPAHHLAMGRALAPLVSENILLLASGGAVHNLSELGPLNQPAPGWAVEFDDWLAAALLACDTNRLVDYRRCAPHATRAHPHDEHLLPLFVALGAAGEAYQLERLHRGFEFGALSLAAFAFYPANQIS